jgi:hypothetical protein
VQWLIAQVLDAPRTELLLFPSCVSRGKLPPEPSPFIHPLMTEAWSKYLNKGGAELAGLGLGCSWLTLLVYQSQSPTVAPWP